MKFIVLFWDTMERMDNRSYLDSRWHLVGVNPCGEMSLSNGGSCNLGAINLGRFTSRPYTELAEFDWDGYKKAIRDGIDFLDEVNSIELKEGRAPLPKQSEVTEQLRQVTETKFRDLNAYDLVQAERIIAGTARSMGIEIVSP